MITAIKNKFFDVHAIGMLINRTGISVRLCYFPKPTVQTLVLSQICSVYFRIKTRRFIHLFCTFSQFFVFKSFFVLFFLSVIGLFEYFLSFKSKIRISNLKRNCSFQN